MSYQIKAFRGDTNVPLSLSVSPASPVASAAVVAIRDQNRTQSPPFYLDFADLLFKQAGWTTRQAALVSLGNNFFALDGGLDIAAIVGVAVGNLPVSSVQLAAEYTATVGGQGLNVIDNIELAQDDTQVHVGFARIDANNIQINVFAKRRGLDVPLVSATLTFYNSNGTPRPPYPVLGPPPAIDPQGHLTFAVADTLVAQASYCVVTITDAFGSYTTHRAVPFQA